MTAKQLKDVSFDRATLESLPVGELPLSPRTFRALKRLRITKLGQILYARRQGKLTRLGMVQSSELEMILEPYLELWRRTYPGRNFFRRNLCRRLPEGARFRKQPGKGNPQAETRFPFLPPKYYSKFPEESIAGRTLTDTEVEICKATPVSEMGLSVRASRVAGRLGCATAIDIAVAPAGHALRLKDCGKKTFQELRAAVRRTIEDASVEVPIVTSDPNSLKCTIDEMLNSLTDKEQFVIRERFGLWDGTLETLEDIGYTLGVTRERVRQIEGKAFRHLRHSPWKKRAVKVLVQIKEKLFGTEAMPEYGGVFTEEELQTLFYPEVARRLGESLDAPTIRALAFRFLSSVFAPDFQLILDGFVKDPEGRYFVSEPALNRFQVWETRARTFMITRGRPAPISEVIDKLRDDGIEVSGKELDRYGEVSSIIGVDWTGSMGLRRWRFFQRRNAAALIQRALMELGEPTHYSYVVERLNFMFPDRGPFSSHAVSATMLRYPDVFVSLGRGMYALRNWGITRPPFLKDFLVEALQEKGGKATIDELAEVGAKKYGFKKNSISMTLSMNPRFFRHLGEGWYAPA